MRRFLSQLIAVIGLAAATAASAFAAQGPSLPPAKAPVARQSPATVPTTREATAIAERSAPPELIVGDVRWRCAEATCRAAGSAALGTTQACQALARKIGPIKSYTYTGGKLDRAALAECNREVLGLAPSVRAETRARAAGTIPVTIEANYVAEALHGLPRPGASAGSGDRTTTPGAGIALEVNYIAQALQGPPRPGAPARSGEGATSAGPPIRIEMNYVAEPTNSR